MDEARAREVLIAMGLRMDLFQTKNQIYAGVPYTSWAPGNKTVCCDGDYTAEQMEAIAWWMRHKSEARN